MIRHRSKRHAQISNAFHIFVLKRNSTDRLVIQSFIDRIEFSYDIQHNLPGAHTYGQLVIYVILCDRKQCIF